MLATLKQLFGGTEPVRDRGSEKRLAAAALLVEIAAADGGFDAAERAATLATLMDHFDLDRATAERLVEHGAQAQDAAADLHRFTREIVAAYPPEDRAELLEMLWTVALADGRVHHMEGALMRRIAGLLGVPDRESGLARQRAMTRSGS